MSLQTEIHRLAESDEIGTVCAVRLNGRIVWEGAAGFADRVHQTPLRPDDRFCVYSITKSFTAACVLRMRDRLSLSLDARIDRWFPRIAPSSAITLRHLLLHTAGLRDYGSLQSYFDAVREHPGSPWTEEEYLADTVSRGLLFEPGSRWAYSNVGYLLVKRILELESGCSFKKCLANYVFAPLNLTHTSVAEELADWEGSVPGYSRDFAGGELTDVRKVYHPGWCAPGVAVSTAQDVTAFYEALFAGDFLSECDRMEMTTLVRVPGKHPPAICPSYGLGLIADPEGTFGASFGHGGAGPGYSLSATALPHFAEGCLSVAVFRNGSGGVSAGDLLHGLLPGILQTVQSPGV